MNSSEAIVLRRQARQQRIAGRAKQYLAKRQETARQAAKVAQMLATRRANGTIGNNGHNRKPRELAPSETQAPAASTEARTITQLICGDPGPGRSALDRRRG